MDYGHGMSGSSELLATMAVIAAGALIGRVQVRGVRLDVAAMLLLGVAVAHFGISLSPALGLFGLLLFLYTVGVRSGPALRNLHRKDLQLATVGVGILALILAGVLLFGFALGLPPVMSLGSFAGFFGSGAALALLERGAGNGGASAAFAISAPISAVLVMLLVQIWHARVRKHVPAEIDAWNKNMESQQESTVVARVVVDKDAATGLALRQLRLESQVLWVNRDGTSFPGSADTVLARGDVVHISGSPEGIERTVAVLGRPGSGRDDKEGGPVAVHKFFVSNAQAIEVRLEDLLLRERYGATVTRIRRAGINLRARHGFRFRWGDRVQISAPVENIESLRKLFGDEAHGLEKFAFPRAALVIFAGGLIGAVPIQLGASGSLRLGPALGVLVVSLVTAALHRTGPMVWSQSGPTTSLMSQIGLPLFLAQVGNESYVGLEQSWADHGTLLFALAIAPVALIALFVGLAGRLFDYGPLTVLSLLPSVALNTPALTNVQDSYRERIPSHIYAAVYPVVALALLASMFALSFFT